MQPRGVRSITGAPLLRMVPILEGEVEAAACGDNDEDDGAGAVRGRGAENAAPAELGLGFRELQGNEFSMRHTSSLGLQASACTCYLLQRLGCGSQR